MRPNRLFRWLMARGPSNRPAKPLALPVNQRRAPRFSLPAGHTVICHQTIWPLQDISLLGLKVRTGSAAEIPDGVCSMTIRWGTQEIRLQVNLVWRDGDSAGFAFAESSGMMLLRLSQLIEPVMLGSSLALIDPAATLETEVGKRWFHGQHDTNLWVWTQPDSPVIQKWLLYAGRRIFSWKPDQGLEITAHSQKFCTPLLADEAQLVPAKTHLPWLRDLMGALKDPLKAELLMTLTSPRGSGPLGKRP